MRYQPACVIERWRPEQIPTPTTKYWQEQNQPTGRHFIQCCHIDRLIPPPRRSNPISCLSIQSIQMISPSTFHFQMKCIGMGRHGDPAPGCRPFPSISIHFRRIFLYCVVGFDIYSRIDRELRWRPAKTDPLNSSQLDFCRTNFSLKSFFLVLVLTWRHLKTSRNSNYSAEFTHQLNSKYTWRFLQQSSFFEISNFAVVDSLRMNESFDPARLSFAYEIWPIGWPQSSLLHNINGWLNELDWIMNYLQFFLEKARDEFEYQIDV